MKIYLLIVLEMGSKWVLYVFVFLLTVGESAARSGKTWYLELATGTTSLYSWTIASSSIFILTALVLSLYLIFEHLASYNQPEVCSFHHVLFLWFSGSQPRPKTKKSMFGNFMCYVCCHAGFCPGGGLYVLCSLSCWFLSLIFSVLNFRSRSF